MFGIKLLIFSYLSILTFVLGAQKNRLCSFEYPQHMFWLRNKKINFGLIREVTDNNHYASYSTCKVAAEDSQWLSSLIFPSNERRKSLQNVSSATVSETKLFHFHRIFKKNEIKSVKQTPTPLYI